jgi:dolichol-phosphate mannosyltransferase
VALALLLYAVIGYFTGKTAAGWASLMAAVALLGGVQLFVLGIFGEYLGRLCDQARGRPLFIVDRVVRSGEERPEVVVTRRAADYPVAIGTELGAEPQDSRR